MKALKSVSAVELERLSAEDLREVQQVKEAAEHLWLSTRGSSANAFLPWRRQGQRRL